MGLLKNFLRYVTAHKSFFLYHMPKVNGKRITSIARSARSGRPAPVTAGRQFYCISTIDTFISILSSGLSLRSVGWLTIVSAVSRPETTSPKTVY